MTLEQLKIHLIEAGIKSVNSDKRMRPECIAGSIEGFELMRDIDVSTPEAMTKLMASLSKENHLERDMASQEVISTQDYWKMRYRGIQVEFVFEVMKWGWTALGFNMGPLSARAGIAYNSSTKHA